MQSSILGSGWRSGQRWPVGRALAAVVLLAAPLLAQQDDGGSGPLAGAQRVTGTVTAVAADKLTIKTEKGDVYTVALTANTRLMRDRQAAKATDMQVGDVVFALGVMDEANKTEHALVVSAIDAEQVKKAREGLGKVYIAGKVTAIDELKLTIQRQDGVMQVIEVDEGTKFRRGARGMTIPGMGFGGGARGSGAGNGAGGSGSEPPAANGADILTLADIKVGDGVVGPGSLKNGVFVPSELGIIDQAAMERRRQQRMNGAQGGNGGAAAPPQQ